MANKIIIDATTARDLLKILQLHQEIKEGDIKWALSIIHQIPGYETTSIAKAASDSALKGKLVAIASGENAPTSPKDLKGLVELSEEAAKKRQASEEAIKAKIEKREKDFIKAATLKEKSKVVATVKEEAPPPKPEEVKVEIQEKPTPLAAEPQTPSVGVKISPSLFESVNGLAKKAVLAPIALPMNYFLKAGASAAYSSSGGDKNQSSLSPFLLRAYGVDSKNLSRAVASAKESGKISDDTSKKLLDITKAIKRVETGSPWYIRTVFWAYGGNQVSLVTDLDKISGGAPLKNFLMAPTGDGLGFFIKDVGGEIGQRAIGGLIKRGVTGLLSKLGISVAAEGVGAASGGAAAGAAAGSAVPVIGTIIGAIVGWISSKLISWITKHKGEFFAALGAGVIGLGLLVGSVPLMIFGGVGLGLGVAGAMGTSAGTIAASAANGASAAIVGLASLTVASLSASAIVSLVALPVVIAIILFIINSGAYLVPPRVAIATLGAIESPYIGVAKVVDGDSEFPNPTKPFKVTYTITVTAKKGTLTNIKFDYKCEVVKEKSKQSCPPVTLPEAPKIVSPVEPFTFSYTQEYDSAFSDSFVIDTFTVTADSPDAKGVSAAGSASIKIGNPPDDCPSGWPVHREGGEGPIPIKQGPHTANGTHNVIEAIDISATVGHQVRATHTGTVTVGNYGSYGDFVDVTSVCKTKIIPIKTVTITTRYAHLGTINVSSGQGVRLGQTIGTSDTTGTSEAHLHYEFRPDGTLKLVSPYVKETIPPACNNFDASAQPCGVYIKD